MGLARRKSIRAVGITLAVLLLTVIAVKVFLPAEKIRDLALDQARARLGRQVSVGEVSVSLRGGLGVRLADFAVHNPAGFGDGQLVATRALDLKLELGPLFKGEIRVNRLVVDSPVVNLVRLADGRDNFTFAPPADADQQAAPTTDDASATAPPPLSVASLTLRDGQISFADAAAPETGVRQVQLSGLELGLSLADPAPGRFQTEGKLSAGKIVLTGPFEIPALAASVDFDLAWDTAASRLDITRLNIDVNDMQLSGSGHLMTAAAVPTGQLRVQVADVALAKLLAFLPAELAGKIGSDEKKAAHMSTTVDLTLTADETVRATGNLAADGLLLAEFDLPPLSATADFDVVWRKPASQLDITSVAVKVNDVPVTGSGQVVTSGEAPSGRVQVQVAEVALVDLAAFMPPDLAGKISGGRDSGQVSATVDLTLTGDRTVPVHSLGTVNVRDVDLALAQPFLPPPEVHPGQIHG